MLYEKMMKLFFLIMKNKIIVDGFMLVTIHIKNKKKI